MLRFLLLAVLLACVSAFVPPATLAQRSVVGRAASVEICHPPPPCEAASECIVAAQGRKA